MWLVKAVDIVDVSGIIGSVGVYPTSCPEFRRRIRHGRLKEQDETDVKLPAVRRSVGIICSKPMIARRVKLCARISILHLKIRVRNN